MESGSPIQSPLVLSFVVCDAVWKDPITHKKTILGTFWNVEAREFPFTQDHLAIYAALTDGRGSTHLKVRLASLYEEVDPLLELEGRLEFGSPTEVAEVTIKLGPVTFPQAGAYRIQFFVDDEPVVDRTLRVGHLDDGEWQ